jgi:hypothetical protein
MKIFILGVKRDYMGVGSLVKAFLRQQPLVMAFTFMANKHHITKGHYYERDKN